MAQVSPMQQLVNQGYAVPIPTVPKSNSGIIKPMFWHFYIGPVELTKFEVPEEFEIGFQQEIVTHKFLAEDGSVMKKTHKFGAFPVDTKWEGILYGANALERFQQLESLVQSLDPVHFKYGPLDYTVDVESCTATVKFQTEVHYKISLIVIQANTANLNTPDAPPSLDIHTQAFLDNGKQAGDQVQLAATGGLWGTTVKVPKSVQTTYKQMIADIINNWPLTSMDVASLQLVSTSTQSYLQAAQSFILSMRTMSLGSADTGVLQNSLVAYNSFSGIYNTIAGTLNNQKQAQRTVSVQPGQHLFTLAAQFYPKTKPDQAATMLLQANGLRDYFITQPADLVLPPLAS